ncbi:unannotated protein [freshwater metagenome]|uniref:Unannotated protein n=1 Tax=freshwater metagenome TaxID=449393 RepID=A0A6J6P6Z3_9ZZZZ
MWFGANPTREPKLVKLVSIYVRTHRCRKNLTLFGVRGYSFARKRIHEVLVGDVPLTVVVSVVAGGAEPMTQCRNLARFQPAHS